MSGNIFGCAIRIEVKKHWIRPFVLILFARLIWYQSVTSYQKTSASRQNTLSRNGYLLLIIYTQAPTLLSTWLPTVSNTQQEPFNKRDFQLLKQGIKRQLLPLLSSSAQESVDAQLENKNASLQQLMGYLKELSSSRTNVLISNVV